MARPLALSRTSVAAAVAAASAGLLLLSLLSAPYIEIRELLGDLWVETDAIWRAHLHQQAGCDFVTPLGPLFYGVYRLPLLFEPPSLAAMVHANLIVGAAAALLAWGVARRSAPREAAVLLVLLAFVTAAAGRALGTPLAAQSVPFIVPYNRWAWAIALPTVFALLIDRRGVRLPYLLAGLGLAALFYIKLSYFVALCGAAGAAACLDLWSGQGREAGRRLALVAAGALPALALGALATCAPDYLHDVATIAKANYVRFRLLKFALQLPEACILFGLAATVYALTTGAKRQTSDVLRVALMTFAGTAIMAQNHENSESPLYFGALILAYALGRLRAVDGDAPPAHEAGRAAFATVLLLLLFPVGADVGTAAIERLRALGRPQPAVEAFRGTLLADLRTPASPELDAVLDGLALLRRAGQGSRTVLAFTMGNPFPALTQTRSPRGAMAIAWYGRTFSETHRPPAQHMLGDADLLLLRKGDQTSQWLSRLYGEEIRRRYVPVGESGTWVLWARR
jgi:hypothetical protein